MSTALFVGTDATTQGSWLGVYGLDGYYKLEGGTAAGADSAVVSSLPAGVSVSVSGASIYNFAVGTTDLRAPQEAADASVRDADCWYAAQGSTYSFRVAPNDTVARRIRLYFIDWDSTLRSIQVQVTDDAGTVLDTRTVPAGAPLTTGVWYSWDCSGTVKFVLSALAGDNAPTFGLSFDGVPPPPTGTVEWVLDSASVLAASPYTGTSAADLYDSDFGTYYASATTGGYTGIDLGSGVSAEFSRLLAAAPVAPKTAWPTYCRAAQLEYADDPAGPWTATGDSTPGYLPPTRAYLPWSASPGPAHRCWRIHRPTDYLSAASVRWEGAYTSGLRCRPVRPSLSPAAGRFAAGQKVAITTPTGGASIYYTTDGTTPTAASTPYTGPVTLASNPIGSPTVVQAIAYHPGCTSAASGVSRGEFDCGSSRGRFVPDMGVDPWGTGTVPQVWYDSRGLPVEAHAGCLFYDAPSGLYHWTGEYASPDFVNWDAYGYYIYTSSDLLNWDFAGFIAPYSPFDGNADNGSQTRPRIIINASPSDPGRKYVLWTHLFDTAYTPSLSRAACATAPGLDGPWTWTVPTGGAAEPHDFTLFQDPADGTWWHISDNNSVFTASQLDPATDYSTFTGQTVALGGSGTEAPVVFFRNGHYFLLYSDIYPYNSSNPADVQYRSATSLAGLASAVSPGSIFLGGPPAAGTAAYVAQPTWLLPVHGKVDSSILVMDRWIPGETTGVDLAAHARLAWYPLTAASFPSDSTLAVDPSSPWDMSVFSGPSAPNLAATAQYYRRMRSN